MSDIVNMYVANRSAGDLTFRLLSGGRGRYGAAWGNDGRVIIRDAFSRLYLLESGGITVQTGTVAYRLGPGDLWLIPAGVAARYRCVAPSSLNWLHINLFQIPEMDLLVGGVCRSVPAGRDAADEFHAMLAALDAGGPRGLIKATALAAKLLSPFLPEQWEGVPADGDAMQRLRPVLDRISSGLSEDCSVAALAKHVNLHPVYFSRLFSRALGVAPGEYVTRARMRRAAVQLATTSLPVKAIGSMCGYPDPYHFSRAFKRHVGVSPTVYRQAQA